MKTKIYSPDIECESCIKVLTRAFKTTPEVERINFGNNAVIVTHSKNISPKKIVQIINAKGYRASLDFFERVPFRQRVTDFLNNPHKYDVEYSMLKYSLFTFLLLLAIDMFAYITFLQDIPDVLIKYGWWFLYLNIAIVSLGAAIWHMKSYRSNITCMVGMMIGMTFGMQTGMMLGTIFAATNGLFVGGLLGMIIAVSVGFYNGSCCGIMGAMEGMMAGVMGGIMGSMIGAMFSVDHILWFMPFFMFFNVLIVWGLSYMLFEEVVEDKPGTEKKAIDFSTFFFACFLVHIILGTVIIYGPRTGLAALIG